MIRIILDKEGTGKTKRLIEQANRAALEDGGDIVYIDDNKHHMYELNYKIRFIDTSDFVINDFCVFHGFICGIISENFDISQIYIDDIFKIVKDTMDSFDNFLKDIDDLSKRFNITFTLTLNGDPNTAPEFLKKYVLI
ncbi:MAG: hypothetical protein GX066_00705 [Clostridiaceae bacterium]|nr:hypothetical protein [Clostridiaceae bacterium]